MPLTPTLSPLGAAGTIGNSLDRSIGNTSSARRRGARSLWRAQRAAPTPRLSRSLELTGMIDAAEQDRTEVHDPGAAVMFLETNRFPGQHLVDEQSLAAPEDFSGLTHHADLPVIGIGDVGHAATLAPVLDPGSLATLAADLKTVWAAPSTDARLKKRIVRTVIHEVIADIDPEAAEIVLVVHWIGGVHSEMRLPKRRRGQRNSTSADVIAAVRQLALIANDDLIAGILNRNGLVTGNGNRWTRERVTSLRSHHRISVYKPADDGIEPWLNLSNELSPNLGDGRDQAAAA